MNPTDLWKANGMSREVLIAYSITSRKMKCSTSYEGVQRSGQQ